MWSKQWPAREPTIRNSGWTNIPSNKSAVAYCHADEIPVGGGGQCTIDTETGYYGYIIRSQPISAGSSLPTTVPPQLAVSDGWYVDCSGMAETMAFVACLAK